MNEVEFYLNGVKSSLQEITQRLALDRQILTVAAGYNDLALEILLGNHPRFVRWFVKSRALKNWHVN